MNNVLLKGLVGFHVKIFVIGIDCCYLLRNISEVDGLALGKHRLSFPIDCYLHITSLLLTASALRKTNL